MTASPSPPKTSTEVLSSTTRKVTTPAVAGSGASWRPGNVGLTGSAPLSVRST